MKSSEHRTTAGQNDFLIGVAQSIGSTLGAVAAKVSSSTKALRPHPVARRKRAPRKRRAAISGKRKLASRVSKKKGGAVARRSRKRGKKSTR